MINHMSHDLYMAWIYLNSSISPSCRPWKYNPDIEEYFVEDETTVKLKRSDMTKQIETTELDDGSLVFFPKMKCPKDEQLYMDVKPTVVWYIYNAF